MIRQDDIYQDHLAHVFHCLNRRSAMLALAQMRISTTPQQRGGNRGSVDCRAYSVVKCTTRRSPFVHGHTRGLRPKSAEGSKRKGPVSGGAGPRGSGRSHLCQRAGALRVQRNDRHGRQTCEGLRRRRERVAPTTDEITAAQAIGSSIKAWRPYIEPCIAAFGPLRLMFESNFPVDKGTCSYQVLWNTFKRIAAGHSADEKTALFSGAARKAYRLAV